jgi:arylsulfatase A-like enzyme
MSGARRALLSVLAVAAVATLARGCGEDRPAPRPPGASAYDRDGYRVDGGAPPAGPRRNLVVILIDTLRRDCAAMPGEPGGQMPFVTSLARRGVSFADAASPAPWTLPSMTSMLTGLLPSRHGLDRFFTAPRLNEAITTFAEALRNGNGYETVAFSSGPWFGTGGSVLHGFAGSGGDFALQTFLKPDGLVEQWAARRDRAKPYFLLLHTLEAHDPYGEANHPWPAWAIPPAVPGTPTAEDVTEPWEVTKHFLLDVRFRTHQRFRLPVVIQYVNSGYRDEPRPEMARELEAAYRDGARWVDGLVAKAVATLERLGLLQDTLLVVASDHGEAFGEHGTLEHGRTLYDELLRVPLVLVGPEPFTGGRVLKGSVGLIDLLPTFFDWAGLVPLTGLDGRSFLPRVAGPDPGGWPVVSEERLNRSNTQEDADVFLASVRDEKWKYVLVHDVVAGTVREELYDLGKDPREERDLAKEGWFELNVGDFGPAFCAAVEGVRERVWADGTVKAPRPPRCP